MCVYTTNPNIVMEIRYINLINCNPKWKWTRILLSCTFLIVTWWSSDISWNSGGGARLSVWNQSLWHGASVYNGHLRGHVTLTPNTERLAVELSLQCTCFNDWGMLRLGFDHQTFRLRGERSNPLRPITGNGDVFKWVKNSQVWQKP